MQRSARVTKERGGRGGNAWQCTVAGWGGGGHARCCLWPPRTLAKGLTCTRIAGVAIFVCPSSGLLSPGHLGWGGAPSDGKAALKNRAIAGPTEPSLGRQTAGASGLPKNAICVPAAGPPRSLAHWGTGAHVPAGGQDTHRRHPKERRKKGVCKAGVQMFLLETGHSLGRPENGGWMQVAGVQTPAAAFNTQHSCWPEHNLCDGKWQVQFARWWLRVLFRPCKRTHAQFAHCAAMQWPMGLVCRSAPRLRPSPAF